MQTASGSAANSTGFPQTDCFANWVKTSYRKIKGWFKVVVVVVGLTVAMGHSGCQKPPDYRITAGDLVVHQLDDRVQTNAAERPLQP